MDLQLLLRYPAGPDAVAALLADRAFVEELCDISPATEWDVDVTGSGSGGPFTVTTMRVLPTTELPDGVRRFLGASLRIVQVDTWDAPDAHGTRHGSTQLDVTGAPLTATATLVLRAVDSGSEQDLRGRVKAAVPLLGSRVERAAEPVLVEALRDQERLAGVRLTS